MATDRRLWFTHKCRFCSYFFVCEKDLVHHEATHDAPNFVCDSCSSVFDDAEQLSIHVNDGCSAADSSADISRQHVCGTCGEIFRFVRELYKHYGERHMNDRSSLAGRNSDTTDGASMCANCGAVFSGAASLKVHLWKAHNLNVVQQQDHILKKNGPSTVTCRHSDTTSTCRRLLLTDKDKPFKCSMCNWSFKYDFSFRAHLKMHAEKQRVLEEMLRANCEGQTVADDVALVDVGSDNLVSSTGEVGVPIMLFPLKRKLDDADCLPGAKLNAVYDTSSSRSGCCLPTNLGTGADSTRELDSEVVSDQHPVDQASWKPVSVKRVSSKLLRQTPNLSSVVVNRSRSLIKQSAASVDCSPLGDEPFRFACKLCGFKCHYDFSYIAHLNQHDKLKELEIDDLQSHLVASSTQTPSGSHIANKFAIKVISTDTGDVSYVKGHSQVVDSSKISYILLCPGAVDQNTSLPKEQQYEDTVITQQTVAADATDCFSSNVVLVDDVSTNIEQDLDSAARPAADDEDVDFSVGPEMQFLDLTNGETLYVINESDLQVALPVDVTSECQKNISDEEADTEVVLSPQPNDRQLLDVTSVCSDEDGEADDSDSAAGEDSFTCYYCNAMFANKSHLQRHILQLHIE